MRKLQIPHHSGFNPVLRRRIVLVLLCAFLALAIFDTAICKTSLVIQFNMAVFSVINGARLRLPGLTGTVIAITNMGSELFLAPVVAVLAIWLATRRLPREALWILAAAGSARFVGWAAKLLVQSPRPHLDIPPPIQYFSGYGFPSGHALTSAVIYGSITLLVIRRSGSGAIRITAALVCMLLVLAIGMSRIYLGAHWPNDVLGGYLYGISTLLVLHLLRSTVEREASR